MQSVVPRARRALQFEKYLAIAQQALYSAIQMAEEERDQGVADDLTDIQTELRRIHEGQLKRFRRRRPPPSVR